MISYPTLVSGESYEFARCFDVGIAAVARFGFVDRGYGRFCGWWIKCSIVRTLVKSLNDRRTKVLTTNLLWLVYKNCAVTSELTRVFAHKIPEAATAGTPIPGMVLSPTRYKPLTEVCGPGQVPLPAAIAGP